MAVRLAVIPARGGSKRILHKNIKPFAGKPILSYSIAAARASGLFDEIMVSTDSEEVADVAGAYGASVPFLRSEATANDNATTAQALLEVVDQYAQRGTTFDEVCCLYPTAPFVTGETLRRAQVLLAESGADAVIPVVRFSFPPMRGCVIRDGQLTLRWPENETVRSQDLEPMYHDAGQFYFLRTQALLCNKSLWCGHIAPLVLPESQVQDIDVPEDWAIAEMKFKRLGESDHDHTRADQ